MTGRNGCGLRSRGTTSVATPPTMSERSARDNKDFRARMRSQGGESRERSREARKTSGSVADGEVVWSWHPLLMSSRAEASSAQPGFEMSFNPRGDGGKRNSSPGRSRISRNTIAWGMPDVSGASALKTRVLTYSPQRTRGCGCIGHPAFPASSSLSWANVFPTSGASRAPRERGVISSVISGCAKRRPQMRNCAFEVRVFRRAPE